MFPICLLPMALQKVACHLVAKGLQPLPDIMRGTQMPPGQVKQALLLLLQHNYAVAYLHKEDEGIKNARPPYHLYAPCLERMLQIIRCGGLLQTLPLGCTRAHSLPTPNWVGFRKLGRLVG